MNEISDTLPPARATTQAAEGVPRLKWSLAEFERLGELGIFGESDRIELIGGELVPMSPKGNRHEVVRAAVLKWLIRNLNHDAVELFIEPGWRADDGTYVEPDFVVAAANASPTQVAPGDVLLVIEIAHTSLRYDRSIKAATYGALGIRDYWVVDAVTLATRVFRDPAPAGYTSAVDVAATGTISPLRLSALALRMAELGVE